MNSESIIGLVLVAIFLLLGWAFIKLLAWLCSVFTPLRVVVEIIGVLCGISVVKHYLRDRDDRE